jgi:preprotein translocase subunit YajC
MSPVNATSLLAASSSGGGSLFSILILILPLGALFYLMIVPQRKQRAKHAEFVSSLDVGDEVVTSGGMFGRITFLEDGVAHIEIDTDVVVRVTIASISRPAAEPEPEPRGAAGLNGSKPRPIDLTDEVDDDAETETSDKKGK